MKIFIIGYICGMVFGYWLHQQSIRLIVGVIRNKVDALDDGHSTFKIQVFNLLAKIDGNKSRKPMQKM